jgi:hypothetical protein
MIYQICLILETSVYKNMTDAVVQKYILRYLYSILVSNSYFKAMQNGKLILSVMAGISNNKIKFIISIESPIPWMKTLAVMLMICLERTDTYLQWIIKLIMLEIVLLIMTIYLTIRYNFIKHVDVTYPLTSAAMWVSEVACCIYIPSHDRSLLNWRTLLATDPAQFEITELIPLRLKESV